MQNTLTVIARIKPGDAGRLEELLDLIGQDIRGKDRNIYLKLEDFETLHFCRWVMIPNDGNGGQKEFLLFVSYYDGGLRAHLDEFVDRAGEAMDLIWGGCVGYPLTRTANPERFKRDFYRFIFRHSYDFEARHIGYHNERVVNVRRYINMREKLQSFLDLRQVEKFLAEDLKSIVDLLPIKPRALADRLRPITSFVAGLLRFIVFLLDFVWNLLFVFIIRPIRRTVQRREPRLNLQLNWQTIQPGIDDIEDLVTQNQLTVISRIKPGIREWFRVRFALLLINMIAKHFQTKGSLGGIPTIHFAHWSIIDRGRWLLFISNYDGSWDSYIGDFSDKAAPGLDLVWRSAPDYPAKGAIDLEPFKKVIRLNQVKTQAFYSAYPNSTVINILNDRALTRALDRDSVQAWLRRL
ncbi:MAG: hypothetical protein SF029_03290 [bacterium]|nr:hypothetical protein [bacterium]